MNVGNVMTRSVKVCNPSDSLNHVAQLMWENDCGCVPVVNEERRVVAMITDRDVCMAAYTQGKRLADMLVSSAASPDIVTVGEGESLDVAEALMREHQIRRVPVVDANGRPVGILSMNDLVRRSQSAGAPHDGLSKDGVVETLAAICEPIRERRAAEAHSMDHAHAAE